MKHILIKIQSINKTFVLLAVGFLFCFSCKEKTAKENNADVIFPEKINIAKPELADKIKGGWAGQVIGCTYGGPTEFKFNGTIILDYTPIEWNEGLMLWWYNNAPGLYDDIYMDLTFVEVFEKEGLDAPAISHANAFANAEYMLWHANQAARYNILNGINPPESGYWKNNPHSEDIDFQIEADFAGLMSPGMVNTSSAICDKVGHIMNYGDGWYGGVYVAAMYSLAFVTNDIEFIVKESLKAIPEQSEFYQCIHDVIEWYYEYPDDWKKTWFEAEKKWSSDIGCPDGVFKPFNIDAKINAAYIVIGLLYGKGDYGKTIDISTRCGQDSDCNPASAGGILGTMLGYSNIPDYWKQGLDKVESMDFKYTTLSLNDVYEMGLRHALKNIEQNGGSINEEQVEIVFQNIETVKFEKGFDGYYPVGTIDTWQEKIVLNEERTEWEFEFEGTGFTIPGTARKHNWDLSAEHNFLIDIFIDGKLVETSKLPVNYTKRKTDIAWKFDLPLTNHKVKLELKNPQEGFIVDISRVIFYSNHQKK